MNRFPLSCILMQEFFSLVSSSCCSFLLIYCFPHLTIPSAGSKTIHFSFLSLSRSFQLFFLEAASVLLHPLLPCSHGRALPALCLTTIGSLFSRNNSAVLSNAMLGCWSHLVASCFLLKSGKTFSLSLQAHISNSFFFFFLTIPIVLTFASTSSFNFYIKLKPF